MSFRAGLRGVGKATLLLVPAVFVAASLSGAAHPSAREAGALRPAASFAGIEDQRARSVALFKEAAKVLTHPRCMNCHPAANQPLQGDDRHPHIPKVEGGPAGFGVAGLTCAACHRERNLPLADTILRSVPGNPRWRLAPHEMAWEGKSLAQICRQLKDPDRNGGRSLAELQDHMAHGELVAWGWNPGAGRDPAPGTQAMLGELTQAWIDTGAECP